MKYFFYIAAFILSCASIFPDTRFFRSNETGMELEAIAINEKSKYTYYLEVTSGQDTESRKLVNEDKSIKRWETAFYKNGDPKSVAEYKDEKLTNITTYDEKSRILEEDAYADGELSSVTAFTYLPGGKRYRSETTDKDNAQLYSEEYSLGDSGTLREIKKTWPDGSYQITSFLYSRSKIFRELESSDKEMKIERYDSAGQLLSIEIWHDQTLVRENVNTFNSSSGKIEASDINDKATNTTVKEIYDSDGRLIRETSQQADKVIEEYTYAYNDDGKKTRMTRKSPAGLEEWIYAYNEKGELAQEDYFNKGQLEKRIKYADEKTYQEEIYDSGELIVIAYYEKQDKIKEEYYEKGKLARTRQIKK